MRRESSMTREDLSGLFNRGMTGDSTAEDARFGVETTRIKTRAVEANLTEESAEAALARVARLAKDVGLQFVKLGDDALGMVHGESQALVVDVLDPRFWLVHSLSHADFIDKVLRPTLWASKDLDWCWLPYELVDSLRSAGRVKWFKTDFQSDLLAPAAKQKARRLRVQLEGDDAYDLLNFIRGIDQYRSAAPLTALAVEAGNETAGFLREWADYKGRFAATGESFELHAGLVSRVISSYGTYIRRIERNHGIKWRVESDGGLTRSGEVVVMPFGKPIDNLESFLSGMFSCREPFRLWGVPRVVNHGFASVEAVDLHVGRRLRIDVGTEGLRVYLSPDGCGNSVARLLANLQHRYDATIEPGNVTRAN